MGKTIIKDHGWKRLVREMKEVEKGPHARVGLLDGQGGEEVREGGLTNAQIGGVHEFGTGDGRIPERSFLRSTIDGKREELQSKSAELAKLVYEGKMGVKQALGILGALGAAEVQKTITTGDGVPPPNAPSTIARKGSDRPLVDTGRMVQSIAFDVKEGTGR